MAGPSFNKVILIGRLTRDPEKRVTPDGIPLARFAIAVDRRTTGEKKTDFIEVIAWRKLAENVTNMIKKGRLVAVEGSLQVRDYETQTGQRRRVAEVIAQNIQFLDFPKDETVSPFIKKEESDLEKDEISTEEMEMEVLEEDLSLDEGFIDLDKE